jgi:hypothetical protein
LRKVNRNRGGTEREPISIKSRWKRIRGYIDEGDEDKKLKIADGNVGKTEVRTRGKERN